jgi:uncharacterized protein
MTLDATPGTAIGRIASPPRSESTTSRCYFWVPDGTLVEKTQLFRTDSAVAGETISFYGVVEEVYRRSRRRGIEDEVDQFDGDIHEPPIFGPEGVTYAEATILATEPERLTPPIEQSLVYLAGEDDAAVAYGFHEMTAERGGDGSDWRLRVGLLRNGAARTTGIAWIDLRDLSGDRAGHLNVTGQAGRGTKSSFLLTLVRSLIDRAAGTAAEQQPPAVFRPRPIVFNVKGNDLLYIDQPNKDLTAERVERWEQLGLQPHPFGRARFLLPCQTAAARSVPRLVRAVANARQARTYYWTLADVVRLGLWPYLFSDAAQTSESMMALADHVLDLISITVAQDGRHPAGLMLRAANHPAANATTAPQSFEALRAWLHEALTDKDHAVRAGGVHAFGTVRALLSRLALVIGREGQTIFELGPGEGHPLDVTSSSAWNGLDRDDEVQETSDPIVIDIAMLPPELRRFVVAAVLDQVKEQQAGDERIRGRVYFLVLDELGIYAPRGARDPITRLFEHVAAQLRSQGIILLGAQQQASTVSETIFGNSEFKVLGGTSPVELESPAWNRLLTGAQKDRALRLRQDEKMVLTGRGWMNVVVPYPAWAMKESEVARAAASARPSATAENGAPPSDAFDGFTFLRPRD